MVDLRNRIWQKTYRDKHKAYYIRKSKEWCKANPKKSSDKSRRSFLKRVFHMTVDDYNNMFNKQEGKCAICSRHQSQLKVKLNIDHDHTNGKVRGLLCTYCNGYVLPILESHKYLIAKAEEYLNLYREVHSN